MNKKAQSINPSGPRSSAGVQGPRLVPFSSVGSLSFAASQNSSSLVGTCVRILCQFFVLRRTEYCDSVVLLLVLRLPLLLLLVPYLTHLNPSQDFPAHSLTFNLKVKVPKLGLARDLKYYCYIYSFADLSAAAHHHFTFASNLTLALHPPISLHHLPQYAASQTSTSLPAVFANAPATLSRLLSSDDHASSSITSLVGAHISSPKPTILVDPWRNISTLPITTFSSSQHPANCSHLPIHIHDEQRSRHSRCRRRPT